MSYPMPRLECDFDKVTVTGTPSSPSFCSFCSVFSDTSLFHHHQLLLGTRHSAMAEADDLRGAVQTLANHLESAFRKDEVVE